MLEKSQKYTAVVTRYVCLDLTNLKLEQRKKKKKRKKIKQIAVLLEAEFPPLLNVVEEAALTLNKCNSLWDSTCFWLAFEHMYERRHAHDTRGAPWKRSRCTLRLPATKTCSQRELLRKFPMAFVAFPLQSKF